MARILLFETHGDIRTLLEIVVARLGHEAVVSGLHGDDLSNIDAGVIDLGEGDGLSLARHLRQRGIPVIFTSIYPESSETLELGPTAYLLKPFPLYSLEKALTLAVQPARASASF